ncbi:hypothetical protein [Azospirillum sp. SYSU D00513]|uniref:hypothetical protein n=1 Tax=Azospirillum sp. SYSU D00513 TaxID=2812561 RepID=UPI001A95FA7F|nr:hypothetical protein [Azospirillum sp. SYSU D00513]
MAADRDLASTPDTSSPDQRPVPLDITDTRDNPGPDEQKMGFQNIEGPGAGTDTDLGIPSSEAVKGAGEMPSPRSERDGGQDPETMGGVDDPNIRGGHRTPDRG